MLKFLSIYGLKDQERDYDISSCIHALHCKETSSCNFSSGNCRRDQLLGKDKGEKANVHESLRNIQKSHILPRRRNHRKKTGAVKYTAQDDEAMLKRCCRDQL